MPNPVPESRCNDIFLFSMNTEQIKTCDRPATQKLRTPIGVSCWSSGKFLIENTQTIL